MSNAQFAAGVAAIKDKIKTVGKTAAEATARAIASPLTADSRSKYDSGRTIYGEARPRSVDGHPLSLRNTGKTEEDLRFIQDGTQVRIYFRKSYVRFLIGKYKIIPPGNTAVPSDWRRIIDDAFAREIRRP